MSTLLKRFFLSAIFFSCNFLRAQNIVPNGNLEDVNICTELHAPCSPSAWFIVKKYVPGGYYHQYPDKAASGKQYFDLFVVINGPGRQYWQTKLLCKLVPGEKYEASVKVSAAEIGPNLNDIGFYFTNSFIFSQKDTLLRPPVYINFLDAKVKKLKHNWFQLTKEFTATADESCLIIGNFNSEDNRSILRKRNNGNLINLMIDDIAITPLQATICADYQQMKDSLYSIRKRHSGDTILSKPDLITTPEIIKPADTPVTITSEKVDTLRLSNVLFEFDRYVLINPDTLETFRTMLSNTAIKKIRVIGYTDDAGTEAYNKNLSAKRAAEIARLLASKFGISTSIIQAEGKGISTYYTDKSLNRKVDIYIYY
jgi:outer membrane protein OmpA-like peptidoglycan-associated protein